ncbi:MAG: EAL domain-containing protein [Cycloclasticus sp.]|nr:MAG: diguanylate cyclase [Cycloclasticus sp. Phe_18]MBV1913425.1 EAL domain-containing protein [Cycloclasticus sp.]
MLMMILASALVCFYSAFTYYNEKAEYAEEAANELKTISQVLENDYAALIMMGLPSASIELMRKWKSFPIIQHVDLKDANGKPILHFSKLADPHVDIQTDKPHQIRVVDDLFLYEDIVKFQGEKVGVVSYAISNQKYEVLLSELTQLIVLSIPVALTFAIFLSLWLQSIFVFPLQRLIATIKGITQAQTYSKSIVIDESDKSEFASLGRHFNALLERMNKTLKEVEKSKTDAQGLAYYDELTGLANRRLLTEHMEYILDISKREHRHGALLFIDLDNFKTLNDSRGHAAGDDLLKQVAESLKQVFRAADTIARLGGDEFVILSGHLEDSEEDVINQIHSLMLKLRHVLGEKFIVQGESYHLTASVGITTFPSMAVSPEILMKQADTAMYRAKEAGRDGYRFYQPDMQAVADARLQMETDLRFALTANELELFYQPQVDEFGRILGAEALLRWFKVDGTSISPADFIPVAEMTGLILPIGEWVIKEALGQLKKWKIAGVASDFRLSINISPYQFHQENFVESTKHLLNESGVSANNVTLEVTEGITIKDIQSTINKMEKLTSLGFKISMDDFGTGYSSLTYLKKLPLSELKVDQSFVRDLHIDQSDAEIAATIIAMAKNLNLDVVAEGVEEESQLTFLSQHGCLVFQGYYFYKPMPAKEFDDLLFGNVIVL